MYTESAVLVGSSIFIYTLVRFSIFAIPFIKSWIGSKSEETLLKSDVTRLLDSVDKLVIGLEEFTKETNDKRSEIFLKLQNHDDKIEYIEKDNEKVNKRLDRLIDDINKKKTN